MTRLSPDLDEGETRSIEPAPVLILRPAYVSLGAVLNHDDSFIHLLDEPVGSAFERDPASGEFVPVRGKR